jgi:hypothetical protein
MAENNLQIDLKEASYGRDFLTDARTLTMNERCRAEAGSTLSSWLLKTRDEWLLWYGPR